MKHYRIQYCDLDNKEVPVCEARVYRVFLNGTHIRDFPYLGAANKWIGAQQEGAANITGGSMKTTTACQQYGTQSQGASVKCGECRFGLPIDESEQLILCDNPDIKEWHGKNVKHDRNCTCGYGTRPQETGTTKNTMNITSVKPRAFANGFNYFCPDCGIFFSAQVIDNDRGEDIVSFCPCCGEEDLIDNIDGLLHYCSNHLADPVNFYYAFPIDEPIPQSETGATPRQVKIIVSTVILDKQAKRPVTVDSISDQSDIPRGIVEKVFIELNITETGGKE